MTATSSIAPADDVVPCETLQRWQQPQPDDNNAGVCPAASSSSCSPPPPFPISTTLNAKLALWNGALWRLAIDAVAHPTNEAMRDTTHPLNRALMAAAGKEIWVECDSAAPCRTGEAVVTRGCRLPAKKLIHTVGPRYSAKYRTAAESALHMCYRSTLSATVEHRLRSVAVPCLYSKRKGYPRDEATHVAARTVRRFLEHFAGDLALVVLCVDSTEDQLLYEAILPLYFPRDAEELQRSATLLAGRALGDEHGEPVIEERRIRIAPWLRPTETAKSKPSAAFPSFCPPQRNDRGRGEEEEGEDEEDEEDSDWYDDQDDEVLQSFYEMTADPDVERLETLRRQQEERQRQRRQTRPVPSGQDEEQVRAETQRAFDALRQRRFLYVAGVDHSGDPVFAFLASELPTESETLELVLPFVVHTLNAAADSQFSVLFVLEASTDETPATAAWLKRFFSTLATKYERSLRFLYVLEPTMWLRLLLAVSRGLGLSGAFYKKIVYLSSARELVHISSELQLPNAITASAAAKEDDAPRENNEEEREPTESRPPLLPSDSARVAGVATLATAFMRAGRHAVL
ncbi:hypothetical protein P43SY_003935 [Pythium insidiosum]|uniref:Macro domain-containing protein n=1 Tax=Pythium insidiosum TaxID=114742 RepID=A0AAD5QA91_PYTIN|nr:hypothetical protein P43SY_003935 [Pythium insidiosum]